MREDLKAALRSLRSAKTFSVAALIVLTLAIGATTALFSVVDAVVLRGLPFDEHDRLVAVGELRSRTTRAPGDTRDPAALSAVAPQNYLDWSAQQQVFESIAATMSGWITFHSPSGEPESLVPQYVTAEFFNVLRVWPARGGAFTKNNEAAGQDRVVVLSDGLWRRAFGADPEIVGRKVTLDDVERGRGTYEIIGVMPPGFSYPVGATRVTDLWLPYVVPEGHRTRSSTSRSYYLQVIARLKPGVSLEQAQAQMKQIAAAIESAFPDWKGSDFGVRPLIDHIVGARTKSWMLMLLGAVGIVLFIACANVANLLLVRATSREREVSIRAALGASRTRLIRLLLIESLLLSILGTVSAVIVASWGVAILKAAMPDNVPRVTTIAIDVRVLTAAAGLSVITGILFGIVPALRSSKPDLSNALKEGSRTSASGGQRLRSALVIAEVALSVVLLVGAALFMGSFMTLMRVDLGFSTDNLLTAQISPTSEPGTSRDPGALFAELIDRINQIPDVLEASMIGPTVPLQGGYSSSSVTIPGKKVDLSAGAVIGINKITPGFHEALNIPLRRGRLFDRTDRKDSPKVVIINESAARTYFPGEDPIGHEIGIDESRTIIGVVGDIHQTSLEMAPRPEAYLPFAQTRVFGGGLVVRSSGSPYDILAAVKSATSSVLPDVPLRNIMTMEELLGKRVAQRRVNMLLLGLFGILGLLISTVGVYGVMAYIVSQRTREIGVRIALGASPSSVAMMVLFKAAALVVSGLIIGSLVSWYLSAVAKAFLFGIEATDLRAFATAILVLGGAAFIASAIPAARAASVDPMGALRSE